jgi:penicillin-binding protein 2A
MFGLLCFVVMTFKEITFTSKYCGGLDMKHNEQDKQSQATQKVKKKTMLRTFMKVVGFFSLFLFIAFLVAGGWAYKTASAMYQHADISKLGKEPPSPTVIYDVYGNVVTELSNSRMEYLPYDKFPKSLVDAIVSVEDSRFYEHKGVDLQGLGRALYTNLRNHTVVQGGSTITQQLAKVMLYSSEQTLSRKVNEAIAAVKIEQNYSKQQILEMYLNYIYYGEGAYGIQRAAQIYFGKDASELTLAESAMLAGLPKAPTNYSPVDNPVKAKDRRNLVLNLMAEQGRITADQRIKAAAEPIRLADKSILAETNKYPSYVDHVIHEATDKFKLSEQEVLTSGLKIYTNLDPKVQEAAETVYSNPKMFPEDKGGLQSAIAILDAKTGAIRGLVGGLSKDRTFRGFNAATQLKRQPGSSLKPIVAYAPALMQGFKPTDLIDDEETDFNGYKPNNYGDKFHGWVTMEEALVQSYNVPAVAMLKEVGITKGMDMVKQAGIPLTAGDRTFGLALGGMQEGTSPLIMAQAYTMFANSGELSEAYAITKIVTQNGKILKEAAPVKRKVLDPSVAYTMTTMLQKVVTQGTGMNANMNWPLAGKTGTTQLPDVAEFKDKKGNQIDGSKDAWFVGYTPDLVAAVWLGYTNTNRDHYLTTTGGKYPAAIFKEVISQVVKDKQATAFTMPNGYRLPDGEVKRINPSAEYLATMMASAKQDATVPSKDVLTPAITGSASPSPSVSPIMATPSQTPDNGGGAVAGTGTGAGAGSGAGGAGAGAVAGSGAGAGGGASATPTATPTGTPTPKPSVAPTNTPVASPPPASSTPKASTTPNPSVTPAPSGVSSSSSAPSSTPSGNVR